MELCGFQTSSTVACCISAKHYALHYAMIVCSAAWSVKITTSNGRMSVSARHMLQVDLKLLYMRLDIIC